MEKILGRMGVGGDSCFSFSIGFKEKPYMITLLSQFTSVDLCSLHQPQYGKHLTHTHILVFSVAT